SRPLLSQPQSLPPMSCFRPWSWSVLALLLTSVVALDVAVWVAPLGPEEMFPPAIETGVLAFTAFWSLLALPSAPWFVWAFCTPSWKPPAPPQPARHDPPPMSWLRCWSWSVLLLFQP